LSCVQEGGVLLGRQSLLAARKGRFRFATSPCIPRQTVIHFQRLARPFWSYSGWEVGSGFVCIAAGTQRTIHDGRWLSPPVSCTDGHGFPSMLSCPALIVRRRSLHAHTHRRHQSDFQMCKF